MKTRQYFLKDDWNLLLVVAETGEWLHRELEKISKFHKKKTISIIYADPSKHIEAIKSMESKKNFELKEHRLRWWLHNQHLTIFLDRKRELAPKALRGIYFTRRLRASYINPVLLEENPGDIEILLQIYYAYLQKSDSFSEQLLITKRTTKG